MSLFYQCVPSPVGELTLVASSRGLVAVLWENDDPLRVRLSDLAEDPQQRILVQAESELKEYFAGQRRAFSVPLDLRGTSFQRHVWEALLGIPFGETRTYGQLAQTLGNPKASRAVGSANRCNPVSIIVPCHRVIGTSGKLTGFTGGLEAKAYLLDFESRNKAFSTAEIRVSRGAARQSY